MVAKLTQSLKANLLSARSLSSRWRAHLSANTMTRAVPAFWEGMGTMRRSGFERAHSNPEPQPAKEVEVDSTGEDESEVEESEEVDVEGRRETPPRDTSATSTHEQELGSVRSNSTVQSQRELAPVRTVECQRDAHGFSRDLPSSSDLYNGESC